MANTEPGSLEMNNAPKIQIQRMVEMKLPLTWLMSSVVAILFGFGVLYQKFDTMQVNFTKLDAKTDIRDDRMQTLIQSTIETKAQISAQDQRLIRLESDQKDLRTTVESIRNVQRWAPK